MILFSSQSREVDGGKQTRLLSLFSLDDLRAASLKLGVPSISKLNSIAILALTS